MRRAILSNLQQAFYKPIAPLTADPIQTLADRFGHGDGHALASQFR
jgi:hypothetical protein